MGNVIDIMYREALETQAKLDQLKKRMEEVVRFDQTPFDIDSFDSGYSKGRKRFAKEVQKIMGWDKEGEK